MDIASFFRGGGAASVAQSMVSGDFSGAAAALAQGGIKSVTFQSQLSPPITIDPFAPTPPAPPGANPLMMFVKPSVTLETAAGVMEISPFGKPTANYFIPLVIGTVLVGIGAVVAIGFIARRIGK